VPIRPFIDEGSLDSIKAEIETFNNFKIEGLPSWITPRGKRNKPETRFASIVFAVKSEEIRKEVLRLGRISIAGVTAKVVQYIDYSKQCFGCYRYGHSRTSCSRRGCRLCAGAHYTKDHLCKTCKTTGKTCPHLEPQCINCKKGHTADSPICQFNRTSSRKSTPTTTATATATATAASTSNNTRAETTSSPPSSL